MPKGKSYDSRSSKAPKRARVVPDPLPQLPQEILEQIFLNLNARDLLHVRRTCLRWRDAVGSCSGLRDKFRLTYPPRKFWMTIPKPPGTVPASTVEFQLFSKYLKIGDIDPWWPQIASTVTCLVMTRCEFPLNMLRHAPNLKSLELYFARIGGSHRVNFKLNNLRSLSLKYTESLECVIDIDSKHCVIAELIQSSKSSLKKLVLDVSKRYLKTISLPDFAQAHRSIDELTIVNSTDDDAMLKILQASTNLKRLKLKYPMPSDDDYDGILMIPNLEWHLPKLQELVIISFFLKGESLCRSLRSSPNLRSMILVRCEFESWNQLFRLITQPKSLCSLTFTRFYCIKKDEDEPILTNPSESLRYLRIRANRRVQLPSAKVFALFPHLTELIHVLDYQLSDVLVKEACRTLTRLERLTMGDGRTTTHCAVAYIRRYCRDLKHLTLLGYWRLKKTDKQYLEQNMVSFRLCRIDWLRFDNDSEDDLI
ncbi:uncharacterized protein LOC128093023 [Culex pipiens pallens]|uniref:uncharacterized protein LOC128093023 n=1 Tax=Culex pipiens pallens TaxID=42434 RepID=UPI0022AA267D|nr:uncharacterized protein LOC128093023 [Culex pipiens pallens]